mgnify:CR=1 FL=1
MMMNTCTEEYPRRRSFLGTLAWGVCAAVVLLILGGSGVVLYGMNIADRRAKDLAGLADMAVKNLPELRKALPPALADLLDDTRCPEYRSHIEVSSRLAEDGGPHARIRPIIEVRNKGDELVSLLSLRVVVLNDRNDPVYESNEWAATPIAAERDWRGPLMPGATTRIVGRWIDTDPRRADSALRVEATITDIRVWRKAPTSEPHAKNVGSAEAFGKTAVRASAPPSLRRGR